MHSHQVKFCAAIDSRMVWGYRKSSAYSQPVQSSSVWQQAGETMSAKNACGNSFICCCILGLNARMLRPLTEYLCPFRSSIWPHNG